MWANDHECDLREGQSLARFVGGPLDGTRVAVDPTQGYIRYREYAEDIGVARSPAGAPVLLGGDKGIVFLAPPEPPAPVVECWYRRVDDDQGFFYEWCDECWHLTSWRGKRRV